MKKITFRKISQNRLIVACFFALSVCVSLFPYLNLDIEITHFLQSFQSEAVFFVMKFVTSFGNVPFMQALIALCFIALLGIGYRLEALISLTSVITGAAFGQILKAIISRPRPSQSMVQVFTDLNDKSFPSNHVLTYVVFFGFILYLSLFTLKNKVWKFFLTISSSLLLLFIGVSRVYLGAHWATDVLGGYLAGALFLSLSVRLYRKYRTENIETRQKSV